MCECVRVCVCVYALTLGLMRVLELIQIDDCTYSDVRVYIIDVLIYCVICSYIYNAASDI